MDVQELITRANDLLVELDPSPEDSVYFWTVVSQARTNINEGNRLLTSIELERLHVVDSEKKRELDLAVKTVNRVLRELHATVSEVRVLSARIFAAPHEPKKANDDLPPDDSFLFEPFDEAQSDETPTEPATE